MNINPSTSTIVPHGELKRLKPGDVLPSRNNPRRLFDPEPLLVLKENIREHGVLVPITVYKIKAQDRYQILDGQRRHRCCVELEEEGIKVLIPANIVDPPTKMAGLLYMFSIHNFREGWELMPVALSLRIIMKELGESDSKRLCELTGLSEPQVERCKILLTYNERHQKLSLDPDPAKRIPANLWIEAFPMIDLIADRLPKIYKLLGRDGLADIWAQKYDARSIKSVIHFRRIIEAADQTKDSPRRTEFNERLERYIEDVDLETRACFDTFVFESKKIETAKSACEDFIRSMKRAKVEHLVDREEVARELRGVLEFVDRLLSKLEGSDPPEDSKASKHR